MARARCAKVTGAGAVGPERIASRLGVKVADRTSPTLMTSAHPRAREIPIRRPTYPHVSEADPNETTMPGPNPA